MMDIVNSIDMCYFCLFKILLFIKKIPYNFLVINFRGMSVMKNSKWYEKNYRRHLLDMHIADWDESFLSEFSAETYFENLKRANVTCAMLYYQSHAGLCYYPTKSGKMHGAFIGKEDEMKKLTNMCRANGVAVVGYYSLNYNTWAHDEHPEWRMIEVDGCSKRDKPYSDIPQSFENAGGRRYGLCCPNNDDYLNFVYKQIDEMIEYFTPHAFFFDMLFWPHQCYCKHCQKRWKDETGIDGLPTSFDENDPMWKLHYERRNFWIGEYAEKITAYVHSKAPHLTVEHNVSAAAKGGYFGTCNKVNNVSEFAGGDLSGGLLEESVTCKMYSGITMNQPFEYMFPKCEPSLYKHTLTKTDDHIEAAVFLTAAHHGATLVIDAIDPVGTMNIKSFDAIGRAFAKQIPYEKYFVGESIADIAVAYGLESKSFGLLGNKYTNHDTAVSFIKNMIEAGIPVDVVSKRKDMSKYKMVFASCLWQDDKELIDSLLEFAENGGVLYVGGAENKPLVEKITGGKVVGMTTSNANYLEPKNEFVELFEGFDHDYPLQLDGYVPLIELDKSNGNVRVLATLTEPYTKLNDTKFASIHSNPPGIHTDYPTALEIDYGKGKIIYLGCPIENEGYIIYQKIIRNLIDRYVGLSNLSVSTTSPTDVETVAFRDGNDFYINNVLLYDPKNKPHIPSFEVRVKTESNPKRVLILPDETEVDFVFDGKFTTFTTRETKIFDMYKIEI